VSAVQCSQKSDNSHLQVVRIPARNTRETPVLEVNDSTPGCERLASAVDRQLQMLDFSDNREAAAAAVVAHDDDDNDDDNVRSGYCSSAIPPQRTVTSTVAQAHTPLSSAAVHPSTAMSRDRRDEHQARSAVTSDSRQPSRRTCHVQTSVDVDNTSPSSVRISTAG